MRGEDRGIFGSPTETRRLIWWPGAPRGPPSRSDYFCQSMCASRVSQHKTWAHSLKRSFKTANLCLFLSGRHKEYKLKQDDMQTGRQKFLHTLLSRGFNKRKAAWNSHLLSAAWNKNKNTTASHKPPFIISWQGKKKNWNIWKCWTCLKGR